MFDDELFRNLPVLLAQHFGAKSCLLAWHNKNGGADLLADSGYYQRSDLERYATEFAMHDPWLHASESPALQNKAINLEQLVPVPVYEQSFFYNEFIREMGDDNVRAMGIRTDSSFGIGIIALHRGKTQETFMDEEVRALDQDAKHLRRMLAIRSRFEAQGRQSATYEAVLDHMRDAAILVGEDRRVSFANLAAETLLKQGHVLIVKCGRICPAGRDGAARMQTAIEAACAPGAAVATAVLLERSDGRNAVMTVTPFKLPHGSRQALLLIHDDKVAAEELGPQLRQLFGLTQSEAAIAMRVGDGLTVIDIACERGVAAETIRSQMKTMMAKLGCHRQSEVVALIKAIPLLRSDVSDRI
ncbi:MAG TPA: LuxR C-terminal-related transcriptional regulator [Allosphingosinicella sp.]|nr:LuxR C-terminal-related transcriptional regulator [Allosphingosinicella sp.]